MMITGLLIAESDPELRGIYDRLPSMLDSVDSVVAADTA